jgi:hypothetical protein
MTDDNAFRRKARKHQKATGDSYMRVRRHVDKSHASDADAAPTDRILGRKPRTLVRSEPIL